MTRTTHQAIREAIRERIVAREWALGERMPDEADFAAEYGCARTTVNRALRALAAEGIVERRRKGGTRVSPLPLPHAQFRVPVLRQLVESRGQAYSHAILLRETRAPPPQIVERMQLGRKPRCAYLETLHRADGRNFAFEKRWVNLAAVPQFEEADLSLLSANEWLLQTVPFTRGEVALTAISASPSLASAFDVEPGSGLFAMERSTWLDETAVTFVTLTYEAGYRLEFAF